MILLIILVKENHHSDIAIENEVLSYKIVSHDGDVIKPKIKLADTSAKAIGSKKNCAFGPGYRFRQLIEEGSRFEKKILEEKEKAFTNRTSFLFSKDIREILYAGEETYSGFLTKIRKESDDADSQNTYDSHETISAETKEILQVFGARGFEDLWPQIKDKNLTQIEDQIEKQFGKERLSMFYDEMERHFELMEQMLDPKGALQHKLKILQALHYRLLLVKAIATLSVYGNTCLNVIDTKVTGAINTNSSLPLMVWNFDRDNYSSANCTIPIDMDKPTPVSKDAFKFIEKAIQGINAVLSKVVPDVELQIKNLGNYSGDKEHPVYVVELMSKRGGTVIPLRYESDGLRRIISIMSLLVAAYNQPNHTIAIDEIDSGIFEYLLGEILQVMSESAKGQMVFTSHNLRPLEVLPPKCLYFTTTDPQNRFIKLSNRGNSNLRDGYFRSIVLGTDKGSIYNPTDHYLIERAFHKAGSPSMKAGD